MPLALPSSAPSLGAVAGHRRRNAPVHAARQVANNDSKTHGALVQQAVNALQNCAGKDAELLQLIIGLIKYIDKDTDGAPHGGAPTTPKRRRKPTQKQRRARRAAATAVLQAAVQDGAGAGKAARLREAAAARATRPPAAAGGAGDSTGAGARGGGEAEAVRAAEAAPPPARNGGGGARGGGCGRGRARAAPARGERRRDWATLRATSVATRTRGATAKVLDKRKHDDGAAATGSPPKGRRIGAA